MISLIGMTLMPKYILKLRKPAAKYFEQLPPKLKNKIKEVINQLQDNPYAIPNVKPLEGSVHDDFRIRIGSLRLLYRIHNDTLIIIVLDIGPRGDIYK
jgi:mRNA interferase RelE/StbE